VTTPERLARWIGFLIVALTIGVSAVGFLVVRSDNEAMRKSGNETILWSAVQVEIELLRFDYALSEFAADETKITTDNINTRFDILWSRVSLFKQGSVGSRLRAYDVKDKTVASLLDTLKKAEPLIISLQAGDRNTANTLQHMFAPFGADLHRLSLDVSHGEEMKNAGLREELSQSSNILTAISAVTVLASLLLIFIFARETNRFRQLAAENQRLLEISRNVNRAKSQFLAMMSHELRTPMNGVLGLLALVRQQGLSVHQNRLMDQAERSGSQMIGLLRDILDFSALQDNQLELDYKPFDVRDLVVSVSDMFQPVAAREGIEFQAVLIEPCPDRVSGDFARLRKALTHLTTYIVETAGAHDIALDVGYADGCITASISFAYSQHGGEWNPELIMGSANQSTDKFASEALGPSVARGLIERMGGTTKLANPTLERIAVLVNVPAEQVIINDLLIRVVTQSAALEAICKAALRSEHVRFLDADAVQMPQVILIEAGGGHEAATAEDYAKRYPHAVLVALGKPQDPGKFSDVVDVPIDIETVRQSGFMRLAARTTNLAEQDDLRYAEM